VVQQEEVRAQIFISCGQRTEQERQIAHEIADRLEDLQFVPYMAVEQQTLRGFREEILGQLAESEYYLFIDFTREPLLTGGLPSRGSLFSHQELAVASFLDLEVLAFQERGILPRDGLIGILQANPHSFSRQQRSALPDLVENAVRAGGWDPTWKHSLAFADQAVQESNVQTVNGRRASFFHIRVTNRHKWKVAANCCVFLERVVKLVDARWVEIGPPLKASELKWAGSKLHTVFIPPRSSRDFDALKIFNDSPTLGHIETPHADSTQFWVPTLRGPGPYRLTYRVVSTSLPDTVCDFELDFGDGLTSVRLRQDKRAAQGNPVKQDA
jgi:hypothetical protein